jgi:site-specific DNA-cytosine methylase
VQIKDDLQTLGYHVLPRLMASKLYGTPLRRSRMYFIGIKSDNLSLSMSPSHIVHDIDVLLDNFEVSAANRPDMVGRPGFSTLHTRGEARASCQLL